MNSTAETMLVTNRTRGTLVCAQTLVADTSTSRFIGLLGQKQLPPGRGLWIKPSSGVHTWGMRFPIDILALDEGRRVLALWRNVGPWRVRGLSLKTRSVLELAAGEIDHSGTDIGDELRIGGTRPSSR